MRPQLEGTGAAAGSGGHCLCDPGLPPCPPPAPLPCARHHVRAPRFREPPISLAPTDTQGTTSPGRLLPPAPTPGRFPEATWGAEGPGGATSCPRLTPRLTPRKGQFWALTEAPAPAPPRGREQPRRWPSRRQNDRGSREQVHPSLGWRGPPEPISSPSRVLSLKSHPLRRLPRAELSAHREAGPQGTCRAALGGGEVSTGVGPIAPLASSHRPEQTQPQRQKERRLSLHRRGPQSLHRNRPPPFPAQEPLPQRPLQRERATVSIHTGPASHCPGRPRPAGHGPICCWGRRVPPSITAQVGYLNR